MGRESVHAPGRDRFLFCGLPSGEMVAVAVTECFMRREQDTAELVQMNRNVGIKLVHSMKVCIYPVHFVVLILPRELCECCKEKGAHST